MHFYYKLREDSPEIYEKESVHYPPHIHKSIECIYVTKGTLELGAGEMLYHMEEGDFGIIFPNVIHHYQVFGGSGQRGIYFLIPPVFAGPFAEKLKTCVPEKPVVPGSCVHPDIPYAMRRILETGEEEKVLRQAFTQIILARTIPFLRLLNRAEQPGHDIVYDTVVYMAGHYREEEMSLTRMAQELGYSPYALSRVFSQTFHTNFNRYLNELRLERAVVLLENDRLSVTEAALEAGFTSMRTFNRAFQEKMRMSPREYRKRLLK